MSGARFVVEDERARHEADLRRLRSLENENIALRKSQTEGQVPLILDLSRRRRKV